MKKDTIPAEIFNRLAEISLLKEENIPKKLLEYLDTVKPKVQRTGSQNKAMHKWFQLKSDQCVEAGITAQQAFAETMELEMTPVIMKEIWKFVQKISLKKESTTELGKNEGEFEEITEHINRFFSEKKFNLPGIEFPSKQEHKDIALGNMPEVEYPEKQQEEITSF